MLKQKKLIHISFVQMCQHKHISITSINVNLFVYHFAINYNHLCIKFLHLLCPLFMSFRLGLYIKVGYIQSRIYNPLPCCNFTQQNIIIVMILLPLHRSLLFIPKNVRINSASSVFSVIIRVYC
jgi:hypothetical protein